MRFSAESKFLRSADRRRSLVILAGLLAMILVANGVIGLFVLSNSNENHLKDLHTLGQIAKAMESARSAQVHLKKQVQEWKDILLRGSDPQDLAKYRALFEEEDRRVDAELESLSAVVRGLEISVPEIESLRKTHTELGGQYRNALREYQPEDPSSALKVDRKVRGIDRTPTDQMDAIVLQVSVSAEQLLKKASAETVTRYRMLRRLSIAGTTAGVAVVLVFLALSAASPAKD
ncbi:MAG TPA: hypothetical protein VMF06_06735 [Candidatus Limnocylindria bacterium]|jgi:hypothetical protein|nr:hypothetical protein [Candidatus Limnocylindria bacterium]